MYSSLIVVSLLLGIFSRSATWEIPVNELLLPLIDRCKAAISWSAWLIMIISMGICLRFLRIYELR